MGGSAPTIVGGSKKHGGADLGPTRSRAAWAKLGVEGKSLADAAPDKHFTGMPRLTVSMVALLQGPVPEKPKCSPSASPTSSATNLKFPGRIAGMS